MLIYMHRERQYKRKILAWKLDKNIKDSDKKVVLRKQLKRKLGWICIKKRHHTK